METTDLNVSAVVGMLMNDSVRTIDVETIRIEMNAELTQGFETAVERSKNSSGQDGKLGHYDGGRDAADTMLTELPDWFGDWYEEMGWSRVLLNVDSLSRFWHVVKQCNMTEGELFHRAMPHYLKHNPRHLSNHPSMKSNENLLF